jgi:SAM-dependent methyltransferase
MMAAGTDSWRSVASLVSVGKMDRRAVILQGVAKTDHGLEVAPWFAPIAPRRDGYNIKILDVFDRQTLLERGRADANLVGRDMSQLDEVDFVGSATEIADLVPTDLHGTFDYIVSSHNFEHLANPTKFLRGCAAILKPGGLVTMAVPDYRACFDYFRPYTVIGDWIEAFIEDRSRPSPKQVFEAASMSARLFEGGSRSFAFRVGVPIEAVEVTGDLDVQLARWRAAAHTDVYQDAHCTVMTPASLELLLFEARHLGLVPLEVESVSAVAGCEFFVRLRKPTHGGVAPAADVNAVRTALLRRVMKDHAVQLRPKRIFNWSKRVSRRVRSLGRRLRGVEDR